MEPTSPSAPVACSLSLDGYAERGRRWRSLAERAIVGTADTPEGLRLTFSAKPGVEAELRELADLELECCSFADWTVHTTNETVVLDVNGSSPEAVAAVHAMFTAIRAWRPADGRGRPTGAGAIVRR
jgi:hypothetical protein